MFGHQLAAHEYLQHVAETLVQMDPRPIERFADLLFEAWKQRRFVYVLGNGGSATTASHFSEDLAKSLLPPSALREEGHPRLKILSLTDHVGWITAVANDLDYDQVFVQQLQNFGAPGDLVIALSGSGNSPNVLRAVEWANRQGLTTFALTGFDGGRLRSLAQHGVHVELHDMGMVESIHLTLFHWVLDDVFGRIHRCGRYAPAG